MRDNSNNTSYFAALTGIRAVAAYMVFIHHCDYFTKDLFPKEIGNIFNEFHVGVTLFFVLSGFLIAYRYYEVNMLSPDAFRKYWVNRLARIYPMYFILTTLTFLISKDIRTNFILYFLNVTFLRGFFERFKFSGIAPGWSLTVEELFYITAPFSFVLIHKNKWYLGLIPLICLAGGFFLVYFFKDISFYGFFQTLHLMLNYTFFGRVCEFFIGIGLALFYRHYGLVIQTRFCTLIGGLVLIFWIVMIAQFKGDADFGIQHPAGILINNLLLPLTGISVLYWGLLTEKTWFSRALSSRIGVLLGKSSYIFYLIHLGFINYLSGIYLNKLFQRAGFINSFVTPAVVLIQFLLFIGISIALFNGWKNP